MNRLCSRAPFDDQRRRALDGPLVLREGLTGARNQPRSDRWISQEISDRRNESVSGAQLDYAVNLAKFVHQVLKIFHVRTNYHRLSGQDWFDRVLAANSAKALPYHHDACGGVPFP